MLRCVHCTMYTVQVSRHTSPKEGDKELERERGGKAIEYKISDNFRK